MEPGWDEVREKGEQSGKVGLKIKELGRKIDKGKEKGGCTAISV